MASQKYTKYFFMTGASILLAALPVFVFADTNGMATSSWKMDENMKGMRQEIKEKRQELKNSVQDMRRKFMDEVKQKRQEFEDKAKERMDEIKKKLGAERGARIEQFFNQMVKKIESAIDRLNNVSDKISSRLDKAAANGKDVTALRAKLAAAKIKITDAQSSLNNAKTKYADAIKGLDFKTAFANVRALVKDVAAKIKEAHSALVDVTASIKGLGGGEESNKATTTSNE